MKDKNLYRIEEESTSGWILIDPTAVQLTKDQAVELFRNYMDEGYNPNHMRIRRDQDGGPSINHYIRPQDD